MRLSSNTALTCFGSELRLLSSVWRQPLEFGCEVCDEALFFSAFSDIKTVIEDQVAKRDKVACRIKMQCTHTSDYQGIKATNKRITITYMEILQLRSDKVAIEWAEFDMFSILTQLK